jgi:excisionase family DNA binding protein
MFNKRKKERETILRDLRIIKRMLLEANQKPVAKKVVVETITNEDRSHKLYRSAEVAKNLGLRPKQFDGLRKKTNNKPAQGGTYPGDPYLWTHKQMLWFKDYLNSNQHKTKAFTNRNRQSAKLLTPDQAAAFLGIGRETFMRLIDKGEIPFKVLNPNSKFVHRRFRTSDLQQWLTNNQWKVKA